MKGYYTEQMLNRMHAKFEVEFSGTRVVFSSFLGEVSHFLTQIYNNKLNYGAFNAFFTIGRNLS